jgi:DNA-3-methyladenine glycosylase II
MLHLLGCGDPVMEGLVRRIGPLAPAQRRRGRPDDGLRVARPDDRRAAALHKAARSIYGRLTALFDDRAPTPEELISTDEDLLRACGLSRPKVRYLRDLADRIVSGELDLRSLHDSPDEEVIRQITAVKGLGRWSADMFLMFHLGREDVLPVGDLGVRRAAERAYDLPTIPTRGPFWISPDPGRRTAPSRASTSGSRLRRTIRARLVAGGGKFHRARLPRGEHPLAEGAGDLERAVLAGHDPETRSP